MQVYIINIRLLTLFAADTFLYWYHFSIIKVIKKREPEVHFEKDLLLKEFFLLLHELSSSVCWPSSNQVESLQKGGVPAAPSGTATLLRLSPSHQFYPRPLLAVTDFRYPRLPWLDGRCVQGPGTYSPRRG